MSVEVSGEVNAAPLLDDGKNAYQLTCLRCDSKILPPKMGTYEENAFDLHVMTKTSAEEKSTQTLRQWIRVEDMFDFDNVGFSKDVGDIKYLVCADCEVGPVGYHTVKDKKCFVALARVKHQK